MWWCGVVVGVIGYIMLFSSRVVGGKIPRAKKWIKNGSQMNGSSLLIYIHS